jgi:A/G-specific adenine glycosylase
MTESIKHFQKVIWDYYKKYGRHDLPWRTTKDPYKILVSEYMLQQTQVARVIPKYEAFLKAFPTFQSLAKASVPDVLQLWQGLGYNRRALYLKKTAELVCEKYKGVLPKNPNILVEFPGIGPNTAAAICAYSFNMPVVFIETNIRRIFIHFFFQKSRKKISDADILKLVAETVDEIYPREWYWALMDYGTYLKTQVENPNRKSKHYTKQSKFKGSDREIRGKILRILLKNNSISKKKIVVELEEEKGRVERVLATLIKDSFIKEKKDIVTFLK